MIIEALSIHFASAHPSVVKKFKATHGNWSFQSDVLSYDFVFRSAAVISFKLAALSEPIVAGEIGVVTAGPPATLPSVISFNDPAWAPACSGVAFVGFWAGFCSSVAGAGSGGSDSFFSSFFPAHNKINNTVITNARMPMKTDTIPKCAVFTEGSSKGAIAEKQIKQRNVISKCASSTGVVKAPTGKKKFYFNRSTQQHQV
ncbi:hypothetical protein T11_1280 [Trichinella zimbabwensis]|uniref:Uncharacterized protein n=1 Tax=Trichinella zimbabwensis TaxID=268475 RepID=A0A0V1HWN3_9BILA|nr:hypothetical protein T11_1280 [Trichinella zimbabwensis]